MSLIMDADDEFTCVSARGMMQRSRGWEVRAAQSPILRLQDTRFDDFDIGELHIPLEGENFEPLTYSPPLTRRRHRQRICSSNYLGNTFSVHDGEVVGSQLVLPTRLVSGTASVLHMILQEIRSR